MDRISAFHLFNFLYAGSSHVLVVRGACINTITLSRSPSFSLCVCVKYQTTMRFPLAHTLATLLWTGWMATGSHGFSFNERKLSSLNQPQGLYIGDCNRNILSQKDVTKMTTRRETIRMPNQTPMVPWRVGDECP